MKAFIISNRFIYIDTSIVVFAETRGKALAYGAKHPDLRDYGFTGLKAIRCKALDPFYKGYAEMDWFNDEDRVAMVRYANFMCPDGFSRKVLGCDECAAYEWCAKGKASEESDKDSWGPWRQL